MPEKTTLTDVPHVRAAPPRRSAPQLGLILCLVSGISFGFAAVFAKESYAAGWSVPSLLTTRFLLAGLLFWIVVAIRRPPMPSPRTIVICIGLGAIGYALQSGFYFGALTRLGAAVVAQLLYIYPALVFLLALACRRETLAARKLLALAATSLGLVLLLHGGGGAGGWALTGVLMALGSAVTYAIYITVASTLPRDLDPFLSAAVICTSAAVSLGAFATSTGRLQFPTHVAAWFWLLLFALVSTVLAMVTFLAGMRLVGPSAAAILSCVEPVVTAGTSALLYSERLSGWQIAGGVAVLGAVVLLQARRRTS
ncbi:Threonine/homoserine efflux transporter RhtA [Nakamurella panacisegetis]|uniref:Threonine/homoserine efflux transporter RhtA n=1 Tax=Nakamurella panacisegetis TaxID=1090615 RepID=A0A1H0PLF2_9ACTN|nr:DMT family transporter [Nakamurella panacisegetis]SDP05853.1 Threonine/homoserine efflux transporter RhtA [Nakamurella panacisegetis]